MRVYSFILLSILIVSCGTEDVSGSYAQTAEPSTQKLMLEGWTNALVDYEIYLCSIDYQVNVLMTHYAQQDFYCECLSDEIIYRWTYDEAITIEDQISDELYGDGTHGACLSSSYQQALEIE